MQGHILIAAGVRIFAVCLFVFALRQGIPLFYFSPPEQWSAPEYTGAALLMGGPLIASVLLWLFPYSLAKKLAPGLTDEPLNEAIGKTAAFRIGIVLLGVFLVANGAVNFIYWLVQFHLYKSMGASTFEMARDIWPEIFAISAEVLIGLVLCLSSAPIARFYPWLKEAGLHDKSSSN